MENPDTVASPLPAIRQRQQEAAPGPWRYETDDEGSSMGWIMHEQSRLFDVFGDSAQQYINAEFAAHARSDIPWLLSEHDRLVEEVARLQAELEARTTNESFTFQRLSTLLTGGNAATWDHVFDAVEQLAAALKVCQEHIGPVE